MARRDLVSVVESAYRLDLEDSAWLHEVITTISPFLDGGRGVYAFPFDASKRDAFALGDIVAADSAQVVPDLVEQWHNGLNAEAVNAIYRMSQPLATIGERLGVDHRDAAADHPMARFCRQLGIFDQLTLRATDPTLRGIAVCTPVGDDDPRKRRRSWPQIAAHIASGYRLRRGLQDGTYSDLDDADAIFDASGRLEHAAGDATGDAARESLRNAVKAIDRARSRERAHDPDAAVEIWQGLVDGTWSLVDHFDSDGRRYVVAIRNSPDTANPPALSQRERQVARYAAQGHANKEIAYALGLSTSTVAGYLSSAMRKLRCDSRADLIKFYALLGPDGPSN